MSRDDMVMEGILDIRGLVLTTIQPTVVCIIFCEEKLGFHNFSFRISSKLTGGIDGRRRWEAVEVCLSKTLVLDIDIVYAMARRCVKRRHRRLF
jgi:hypothetical protein